MDEPEQEREEEKRVQVEPGKKLETMRRSTAIPGRSSVQMARFGRAKNQAARQWLHNSIPDTFTWHGIVQLDRITRNNIMMNSIDHRAGLVECLTLHRRLQLVAHGGMDEDLEPSRLPDLVPTDYSFPCALEARATLTSHLVPLIQSTGFTHCSTACLQIFTDLLEELFHRMGVAYTSGSLLRLDGMGEVEHLLLYAHKHFVHLADSLRLALQACQEQPAPTESSNLTAVSQDDDLETVSLGEDDVVLPVSNNNPEVIYDGDSFGLIKPDESGEYEGFASAFRLLKR